MVSSESFKCSLDEDCGFLHSCIEEMCFHKSLSASQPIEYLGSALIVLMSTLANSTGIGGGEIMVPLLILLFFFETHLAIPLSLMLMLGSSFINTALKIPNRHPTVDRPLINYDIVSFTLSPLLLGSTSGVLINRIIPDWLILTLITILLFYLTIKITIKALDTKANQGKSIPRRLSMNATISDNNEQIIYPGIESRIFPIKVCMEIFSVYGFGLLCVYIRGDNKAQSLIGIEYCSLEYWLLIVFRAGVLVLICVFKIRFMMKSTQDMINTNYQFAHDIKWNAKNILILTGVGFVGGLGVGLLGIGGGAILNPALVYLGIRNDVAQATAQTMVLLISSATLFQYSFAGMIYGDYAIWFFLLAVIGASAGTWGICSLVEKYQKKYLPELILAVVLGIATLATPTYVISTIVNGLNYHKFQYGFMDYCKS
ncbi:hypothetical protein SteCoe_5395 [Stentor coeruleus]|uniref:Uncharacterized protein n=1 Tax=Stentor coeruleus TaxID=5963 RepID=A0A1R2CSL3_9CILI|nr:hypothetical protein SteCoe_5395 [Stentor coeruleus]